MRASEFRHIAVVQRSTGTADSFGYTSSTWNIIGTWRCARTVQNSRRAMNDGEIWYPNAATYTFRMGVDIKTGDRLQDGDNLYDVISVIPDKMKREINVNAELHNE